MEGYEIIGMGTDDILDSIGNSNLDKDLDEALEAKGEDIPQVCPKTAEELDAFYQANIGLIYSIVKPYLGLDDYADLFQEASIGFIKGVWTYRACGVKLTTYAYACAKNEVRMYLRKGAAKSRSAFSSVSLDAPVGEDGKRRVIDMILDSSSLEKVEDELYIKSAFRFVMHILECEMSKEYEIVVRRTMDGATQTQIAKELNISQSKVSKILSKALMDLKERLVKEGFNIA